MVRDPIAPLDTKDEWGLGITALDRGKRMMLAVLTFMADAAPAIPAEPSSPPHVYLHPLVDGCDSRASHDEVVVCGNRNADEQYRLHADPDAGLLYAQKPVRAAVKVAGGTLSLAADPRKIADAQDDVYFKPRYTDLRLRFTIPF